MACEIPFSEVKGFIEDAAVRIWGKIDERHILLADEVVGYNCRCECFTGRCWFGNAGTGGPGSNGSGCVSQPERAGEVEAGAGRMPNVL